MNPKRPNFGELYAEMGSRTDVPSESNSCSAFCASNNSHCFLRLSARMCRVPERIERQMTSRERTMVVPRASGARRNSIELVRELCVQVDIF